MDFKGRDILSTEDLSKEEILRIMKVTADMEVVSRTAHVSSLLADKIVGVIFWEPSTRTRLSFESAIRRLGAGAITIMDPKTCSYSKGETLVDTALTVEGYVDCIIIRQSQRGGAKAMADAVGIPVINAGDGTNQHPTQALLDLYTIQKEAGTLEGLKIALVGDMKNGRTVHSLCYALSHFSPEYVFCAPDALQIPEQIVRDMEKRSVRCRRTDNMEEALQADVFYMTRIQRERFENPAEYDELKGVYVLTREHVERGRKGMVILHPMPRVDEITLDVDVLPKAAYFREAHNGVFLRMALLAMVFGRA